MKKLLLSTYLLLFSALVLAQTWPMNKPELYGLKGKVESIQESKTEQAGQTTHEVATLIEFDTLGIIRQISSWKDGALFSVLKYEYENDTVSTPVRAVDYNADGSIYLIVVYDFNPEKNTVNEFYDRTWQKAYDEERRPIDTEFYKLYQDMYVEIQTKNEFTGRPIERNFVRDDGQVAFSYQYAYDFLGRVKTSRYSRDGKLSWRAAYKYDKDNRMLQERIFKSNTLVQTTNFSYEADAEQNWIMRIGTRKVERNIFSQSLKEGTEITHRKINYFED